MILVTTAAGQVGSEAARLLAQRGELARVLVRDRRSRTIGQSATDYAQALS